MDILSTKSDSEREDEEAERLIHSPSKVKPPRHDRRRKRMQVDEDRDNEKDSDLSKNYKDIGGNLSTHISIYPKVLAMGYAYDRSAVYHGVEPEKVGYPGWSQAHQRDLGEDDFQVILDSAVEWLGEPILSEHMEGASSDQRCRAALDYAIQTSRYNRAINPTLYNELLARLTFLERASVQGSICDTLTSRRADMTVKTAEQSKRASEILGQLDNLVLEIQKRHASWGMSRSEVEPIVNHLDSVLDDFEKVAFGEESFKARQQEVVAKVIQRDPDEPYMDTFNDPQNQTDADEPYMSAYSDDDSSAVVDGEESNGEPLAP